MELNQRQKLIIDELLEKNNNLTQSFLANKYEVTERTIRSDILIIREFLAQFAVDLQYKTHEGYFLDNLNESIIPNVLACIENGDTADREERHLIVLQKLLLSSGFVSFGTLSELLCLSLSSVSNVITKVEKVLKQNGLALVKKRGQGVSVYGDEFLIRKFIIKYGLLDGNYFNFEHSMNTVSTLYQDIDFFKIDSIIREEINKSDLVIYQLFMNNLIIHVYLAIKRILSGNTIQDVWYSEEDDESIDDIIYRISFKLEDTFHIRLPDSEKSYIKNQLLGKVVNNSVEYSENIELYRWLMINLSTVDHHYGTHFIEDNELQKDLFIHLYSVYERMNIDAFLRNPLIDDILSKYPLAFEIAVFFCSHDQEYLQIDNRDEIGYIAIHFAASMERSLYQVGYLNKKSILLVGSSGLGSARLLEIKLLNFFKDKIIIEILSPTETLNQERISKYDLVISTLPNSNENIMFIKPIPDDSDLQQIASAIFQGKVHNHLDLKEVFRQEFYEVSRLSENKNQVIKRVCSILYEEKVVDDKFVLKVFERENLFDTFFGNAVAIPHPIEASSKISRVYTYVNKEGVDWGKGQIVNVVFLLALRSEDTDKLGRLYDIFVHIIENSSVQFELKNVENFDQFINLLEDINALVD